MNMKPNRRQFLRTSAAVGAVVTMPRLWTRSVYAAEPGAGEKVVLGVMGLSRGLAVASGFAALAGARVKYVCDVDQERLAKGAAEVGTIQKGEAQGVGDFRKILDDPEVHALVVAAPNHWHAPAAILACAAGKHVYVEKPCSQNPREGEMAVEAARKNGRVVQHGTQRRSYSKMIEAVRRIRAGEIGAVRFARSWYNNARKSIGKGKPSSPPAGLDYALWQGPAPERPYMANVVHYNWHWHWHWGNGELGNNGVHGLDLARWGMGVDYPTKVSSVGGRYYFDDDQETPDTQVVSFEFGDRMIAWEGHSCQPHGLEHTGFGVAFYGEKGTLMSTGGNEYVIQDLKGKEVEKVSERGSDAAHFQNFLDAITGKGKLNADIEEAHKSALLCHLGNIAQRQGKVLVCDPKNGHVRDQEAMGLWTREYRQGWEPKV
jgi:predicted dehydrogenase